MSTFPRTREAQEQVDQEHERYFKYLMQIDPGLTSSITYFIILDTVRYVLTIVPHP